MIRNGCCYFSSWVVRLKISSKSFPQQGDELFNPDVAGVLNPMCSCHGKSTFPILGLICRSQTSISSRNSSCPEVINGQNKTAYVCSECSADFTLAKVSTANARWNTITEGASRVGEPFVKVPDTPDLCRRGRQSGRYKHWRRSPPPGNPHVLPQVFQRPGSGAWRWRGARFGDSLIGGSPGAGKSTLLLQTMWSGRADESPPMSPARSRSRRWRAGQPPPGLPPTSCGCSPRPASRQICLIAQQDSHLDRLVILTPFR